MYFVVCWIIEPVVLVCLLVLASFDKANRSSHVERAAWTGGLCILGSLTPVWLVSPSHSYLNLVFRAVTCRLKHCASPCGSRRSKLQVYPVVGRSHTGIQRATQEMASRLRIAGTLTMILFYTAILGSLYTNGGFSSTGVSALPVAALIAMQLMDPKAAVVLSVVVLSLAVAVCLHTTPDAIYAANGNPASTRAVILVLYPALIL